CLRVTERRSKRFLRKESSMKVGRIRDLSMWMTKSRALRVIVELAQTTRAKAAPAPYQTGEMYKLSPMVHIRRNCNSERGCSPKNKSPLLGGFCFSYPCGFWAETSETCLHQRLKPTRNE